MGKRKINWVAVVFWGLCVLCVMLMAALVATAKAARESKAALAEELELARMEAEELETQVEALQSRVERISVTLADAEADIADAQRENETLSGALEDAAAEAEQLRLDALLDVGMFPAGQVLKPEQIDFDFAEYYFRSYEIKEGDAVYQRIYGKSYVENPDIGLEDLRYLKLLHYNFDHEIQVGELIVSAELEADYLDIFLELFRNEYEIFSMYLIDNYWTGDGATSDTASIEENNTSAFCYRVITGGGRLSNHALGRAIDINPQQNPYVSYSSGYPYWYHENADDYIDRDTGYDHVITHEDLCYQLFLQHGFSWGGDWDVIKDYQHFEKE